MRRLILLLAARTARAAVPVPRAAAVALMSLALARRARAAVGLDTSEVKPFADAGKKRRGTRDARRGRPATRVPRKTRDT